MGRKIYALVAAAMAVGLVASGCGNSHNSATKTTAPTAAQLQSLIATPANTQRTDGPTSIPDNGIHMHFLVNGPGADVLNAYKTALEARGWSVTVVASGGWGATGGATYTATQGDTYGVFNGGGTPAPPTSVPAHGRQSPRTPTVAAAATNNGDDSRVIRAQQIYANATTASQSCLGWINQTTSLWCKCRALSDNSG